MQNVSNENGFNMHEDEPVGRTLFHMNGFARILVLTQRWNATRKWLTVSSS